MNSPEPPDFPVERVDPAGLRPHPRNYRHHPAAQLEHLRESLRSHGAYRNVVIAADGTILAGHGVVAAALAEGMTELPVVRLPLEPDSPRALQVLAGDNELTRLAEVDQRELTDILAELGGDDLLLGTGFDQDELARLLLVHHDEITSAEADEMWRGMPAFSSDEDHRLSVTVNFANAEDRADFARRLDVPVERLTTRFWWPARPQDDVRALAYRDA